MRSNERGSAPLEFLLIGLPLLGLTLVSSQVLYSSYCKTVALDAAAEAAQTAALADGTEQLGVTQGQRVLNLAIPQVRSNVEVDTLRVAGRLLSRARVTVSTPNLLLGVWELSTQGLAIHENQ